MDSSWTKIQESVSVMPGIQKAKLSRGNAAHMLLEKHLSELGLRFEPEYPFAAQIGRRWRFDYWLPVSNVGIEIDGGIWLGKGHTGGKHFQSDLDKMNHATVMGFKVLRFSTADVLRGRARAFIKMHVTEREIRA